MSTVEGMNETPQLTIAWTAGSDGAVAAHIFLGQRLLCNWQR